MAGTLTISTLSDGTNSTSSTNCIQGSAKAWVNFAGASGTRNASYNVSSVTRNGTGDYTVNFTNALTDANYSVVGSGYRVSGSYVGFGCTYGTQTTTTCPVQMVTDTGGLVDAAVCSFSFFR
jgi:hypothetical protein